MLPFLGYNILIVEDYMYMNNRILERDPYQFLPLYSKTQKYTIFILD